MRQYIIFSSLKPINVSSDFITNYLKKKLYGAPKLRNIKNKDKNHDIFTIDANSGVPGVSKQPEGPKDQ